MKDSKIEWTSHTFNCWIGCARKSPGCANCYAETQDKFRSWTPEGWGKGKPRKRTSASYWKQPHKWDHDARLPLPEWLRQSHHRTHIRPRVFCASLADWLDDEVPIEWLADLLKLVHETPNLDWLLLTKRPENWKVRIGAVRDCCTSVGGTFFVHDWVDRWLHGKPPKNIWIGTTVEDQRRADERLPLIAEIPAVVRFLSCEPLLEAVALPMQVCRPDWIICGGESGPGARAMQPEWARSLRDQATAEGVAFFFKQWGGTNKKATGRELDGRTWDELPNYLEPSLAARNEDSGVQRSSSPTAARLRLTKGNAMNQPQETQSKPEAGLPLGAAPFSAPLAGQKYMLSHCRFGRATVKVTRVDETWADCDVLSGAMRGMGRGAVWGPGDTKTVRIEHGVWTLAPNDPSSATRELNHETT